MKKTTGKLWALAAVLIAGWSSGATIGCGESEVEVVDPGMPGQVPTPAPTQVTVNINQVFVSTPIIIKQNITKIATVIIVNNVTENHWIIADNRKFDTGVIRPGDSATVDINEPGDYPFHCGIHPNESGVIRVEPADEPITPTATPTTSPSPSPTASPSPEITTPAITPSPGENTIIINVGASTRGNEAFGNAPIVVRQNSTVTVINNDTVDHTATADDESFDTGTIRPGERETFVAEQAGEFPFHCEIHPEMKGLLRVLATAEPSPTESPMATPTASPMTSPSPPAENEDS